MNNKIQYMTGIALMSAVICLLGPIVIPIGIVPISFAGIGIYLSLFLLGRKRGAAAVLIYLFLGFMGLPVFSGFTAGPGRLLGPTGGYLTAYFFSVLICGKIMELNRVKTLSGIKQKIVYFGILLLGNIILYTLGTLWLCLVSNLNWKTAVAVGVIPFLLPDVIKNLLVISLGVKLRKRIPNVEMQ